MNQEGHIAYAVADDTYLLKFRGDIRFHHCLTVDRFIQRIFSESKKPKVIIDLLETRALDSTALGVIAQIAIHTRRALDRRPTILVCSQELITLLQAVSFDKVFTILSHAEWEPEQLSALDHVPMDERDYVQNIVQAHRHLSALSRENQMLFQDIAQALGQVGLLA